MCVFTENSWYAVTTPSAGSGIANPMWLVMAKSRFLPFHVMACKDARLILTSKPVRKLYKRTSKFVRKSLILSVIFVCGRVQSWKGVLMKL